MSLSAKLVMRQGQSLVMTPQLLQAIKLLQLSNVELSAFVEEELERNPLLERGEEPSDRTPTEGAETPDFREDGPEESGEFGVSGEDEGGDWLQSSLQSDAGAIAAGLDTDISNTYDADRTAPDLPALEPGQAGEGMGLSEGAWAGSGGGASFDGEAPNLEAYVAERASLWDHLLGQLHLVCPDPADRLIGAMLVDSIDEAGYFIGDIVEMAERLGAPPERVARLLSIIQTFEPSGIGGRDLAECLAIQLGEKNRLDPAMRALLANLPLLARRDFAQLKKICGVDDEDMADMVAEIRRLDPKPGRAFSTSIDQLVIPDVHVRAAPDGSWLVELNSDALPRVLVNQTYAARVSAGTSRDQDKSFVAQCLQSANWLTKSLEQRARTILKVSSEIVRQQDAFLARGVEHLRPLNLKAIADVIGMHESTVSRVTSSKYMATPRGLFELKYFFTAAIGSSTGGESHSAESVRFKIRQLIEAEGENEILSDDAIVLKLKEAQIDIARRTVAKYRESLRIPSSVERRREKAAAVRNTRVTF